MSYVDNKEKYYCSVPDEYWIGLLGNLEDRENRIREYITKYDNSTNKKANQYEDHYDSDEILKVT